MSPEDPSLLQEDWGLVFMEHVTLTLNHPDHFEKGAQSHETIAIKSFDGKRVRVIYVSESDEIRIITVTH